ncbi:TniQ family protein [Lichenibacterium ramalinae]|nr:TniQ family protein [Lichenibacterium ramalinae]
MRWTKPKVGEPAHGFFLRVTSRNHLESAAAFARQLGLNDSDDVEGCLVALSGYERLPKGHIESLRHWTPRFEGSTGVLAGETIRRDDWSSRYRKHCRACLAEDAYHRTWWDLTFVHVCPFHGLPVSDRLPDGTRAYFHTAEMTYTPGGVQIAQRSPRLERMPDTLEAYALGRLGLVPRREVPFLDEATLGQAVEACEVVGRLRQTGWQAATPRPLGLDSAAAASTKAAGFAVLSAGRTALKDLLRDVAAEAPPATFGAKTLFGWALPNLLQRGGLCREIVDAMGEVAVELGRHARREATREATATSAAMTMAEVAAEVGQTVDVVTSIAGELGLLLPHKGGTGAPFLMPRAMVPDVAAALERSVPRAEAAEMLGVGYDVFLDVARACDIPKVGSRWGQREDGRKVGYQDRFEREVLRAFLDSIPTEPLLDLELADMPAPWPESITIPELLDVTRFDVPEFFRAVFAGEIRVQRVGRDRGLGDFEVWPNFQPLWHGFTKRCLSGMATRGKRGSDGMPVREATALLEIETSALKILSTAGHFGGDLDDTSQNRLDRDAVIAFFRRYAVAKVYAGALGCTNAEAVHLLRKRGIAPAITVTDPKMAQGKQNLAYFFDRAQVGAALGLAADPEASDGARIVWKRMSAFLGQNQGAFSLWQIKGQSAFFSTFNRLWPVDVRYDFDGERRHSSLRNTYGYSISAQLAIEGANFANRRDQLLAVVRERALWPEMEVEIDATGLVARITAKIVHFGVPVGPRGPKETGMDFVARYGADEVDLIERMLHMLKGGLEPSDRPFDLRTFGAWEPVRHRPWAEDEHRVEFVRPNDSFKMV